MASQLTDQVTQLAEQVKQLAQENEQIKNQLGFLTNHLANTKPRPRQVLPAPETFAGVAGKWDTWHTYVQARLAVGGEAIGSLAAQYWFVYGCLDSKVQALILPTFSDTATPDLLLKALARVYEDPNKSAKAADRLNRMRQGPDEVFTAYLARFERTLYEAGAQDWPDLAKVSALRAGLSDSIKKKLEVQLTIPEDYTTFVKALHQLSTGPVRNTGSGQSGGNYHGKTEDMVASIGCLDLAGI